MKRKVVVLGLLCLVLFAAILAGYWDMLNGEKLRIVRDKATNAVGQIADIVRSDVERTPAGKAGEETRSPPATPTVPGDAAGPVPAAPDVAAATDAPPPVPEAGPSPSLAAPDEVAALSPPAADGGDGSLGVGRDEGAKAASEGAPLPEEATAALAPSAASPEVPAPPAGAKTSAPGAAPALTPPTFDILRVEPDGSTLLAGRAPADATVSLLDGTSRIGSDKANTSGEFVVVLDPPLAVGDHQIRIEARLADGRSVVSAETAIVSVPEAGREDELLAMVEAPDQASRLISIPAARGAAVPEDIDRAPEDTASPEALVLPEAPTGPDAPADGTLPKRPADAPAASGLALPAAPAAPPPAIDLPKASLAVEAVEIEDDTIYVAGRASGSVSVRIYVDNGFLAEEGRLAGDRFLVTAKRTIETGDHTVRADALDAAGAVVARVEVPFFKPEGRSMSAVAAGEGAPASQGPEAAPAGPPAPDTAAATPEQAGEVAASPRSVAEPGTDAEAATAMDVPAQSDEPGGAPTPEATEMPRREASVASAAPAGIGGGRAVSDTAASPAGSERPAPERPATDAPAGPAPRAPDAADRDYADQAGVSAGETASEPDAATAPRPESARPTPDLRAPEAPAGPAIPGPENANSGNRPAGPDGHTAGERNAAPPPRPEPARPTPDLSAAEVPAVSATPPSEGENRGAGDKATVPEGEIARAADAAAAPRSTPAEPAPEAPVRAGDPPTVAAAPEARGSSREPSAPTSRDAGGASAAAPPTPAPSAPGTAVVPSDAVAPGRASTPTPAAPGEPAATAPASANASAAGPAAPRDVARPGAGEGAAPETGIAVIRQPALESVDSRVIIRRGDTLWRISRETYGLGRRYTVIYLANGDQIRDPNRIYPGQVFRVPSAAAGGEGALSHRDGAGVNRFPAAR